MTPIKLSPVSLKSLSSVNEVWVHDRIAEDPTTLGLGDVIVKDRERIHPGAGRLDLLLQDAEGPGRYEVEIQLGPTDPSHIIRTIEYWDMERKRYPQYEHTAVIVAEDITSRFFNVISLLNGSIPIIAIKMTAVKLPDGIGLLFTKVLDTFQLGFVDEDEEVNEPSDRAYWENRGSAKTVQIADQLLELCADFVPGAELRYNKHYIGIFVEGKACNFALFRPRKSSSILQVSLPQSEEADAAFEQRGIDLLQYDKRFRYYCLKLAPQDVKTHRDFLHDMLKQAYDRRQSL
jgi:hypothetical protein